MGTGKLKRWAEHGRALRHSTSGGNRFRKGVLDGQMGSMRLGRGQCPKRDTRRVLELGGRHVGAVDGFGLERPNRDAWTKPDLHAFSDDDLRRNQARRPHPGHIQEPPITMPRHWWVNLKIPRLSLVSTDSSREHFQWLGHAASREVRRNAVEQCKE